VKLGEGNSILAKFENSFPIPTRQGSSNSKFSLDKQYFVYVQIFVPFGSS